MLFGFALILSKRLKKCEGRFRESNYSICIRRSKVTLVLSGCRSGFLSFNNEAFEFNLVFEDAQGITVGTPLVYQGVSIGEVTAIKLITPQSAEATAPCQLDAAQLAQISRAQVACVSVRVKPENWRRVRTDSDFVIRRSPLFSPLDQKHIQMTVWDSNSPELPQAATVVGCNTMVDFYWRQLQKMGNRGLILGELSVRTEFDAHGPVTRTYLLETSRYLPMEMLLEGLLPAEIGWEVTRPTHEDTKILRVARAFPSPQSVSDLRSEIGYDAQTSLVGAEYRYTETFPAGQFAADYRKISGDEWKTALADWYERLSGGGEDRDNVIQDIFSTVLGQLRAYVTPLSRVPVLLTVSLPADIVAQESNAHFINSNQASWIVSGDDLEQGFVAYAVARRGVVVGGGKEVSWSPWWLVVALLLAAAGVAGYWVWREKKKADERCKQDGGDDDDATGW